MVRLIINGVNGFMGQTVAQIALSRPEEFSIAAGVDKACTRQNPFPVYADIFDVHEDADVVIDFSRPEALKSMLNYAQLHNLGVVLATTGFSAEDLAFVETQSGMVPVFFSANMSLGVNLQMDLIRQAAALLGDSFDVEIIEKHHHRKVDAPSGTALALADAIRSASATGKEYVYGRHSKTEKRKPQELGIHAVRGGTIVGEHQVLFIGPDEIIEINHQAHSRQVFAMGALRAASFLIGMPPGKYSMHDLIGGAGSVSSLYTFERQALITVSNMPNTSSAIALLLRTLAEVHINIDMISQAAPHEGCVEISFSLSDDHVSQAISTLKHFQGLQREIRLGVTTDVAKITIKGRGMERQSGVAVRVFEALAESAVNVRLITTSETKISICVSSGDVATAVAALKKTFGV